jgi:hypothetical protein
MAQRPIFPKEVLAQIEQARRAIFNDAPKRFDLLFYPVQPFPEFMIGGKIGLDIPKQRMPETVKQQLQEYAAALFDAEGRHRANHTHDFEMLVTYLTELASEIQVEANAVAAKKQLDYHCTRAGRIQAIQDALRSRHEFWTTWWKKAKRLLDEPATPLRLTARRDDPIKPVGHSHRWIPNEEEIAEIEPKPIEPQKPDIQPCAETEDDEIGRRRRLLEEYKAETGKPSNQRIYRAKNSGIHKPQFHEWLKGELPRTSQTCINFERFLHEKKSPIPRKPKTEE